MDIEFQTCFICLCIHERERFECTTRLFIHLLGVERVPGLPARGRDPPLHGGHVGRGVHLAHSVGEVGALDDEEGVNCHDYVKSRSFKQMNNRHILVNRN